jgi:hypothetical protein
VSTFKEVEKIKCSYNFSMLKPEEMYLFSNTQLFQGFDVTGTHVTQSGNNVHSCTVTGIKNLHKQITKHLSLSASVNQAVRYWLVPTFTETTEHKDQGMFCNIARPAVSPKVHNIVNIAKVLTETQVLSD